MKVVDIATEIFIEQGSPTSTTIPAIAYWIRAKIGWLNTLVFEELYIDSSTQEIMNNGSEISLELVSIVKQAYRTYDLDVQIRNVINAVSSDGILSVQDNLGGTSFTRVNRNEVAKTLVQLRKDETAFLNTMINAYRSLKSVPSQVAGDDTFSGSIQGFPYYNPWPTRRY